MAHKNGLDENKDSNKSGLDFPVTDLCAELLEG